MLGSKKLFGLFFVFRFWFHSEKANVVKEETMFEEEEKEEKKDEKLVEHLSLGAILLTDTGKATNKLINKIARTIITAATTTIALKIYTTPILISIITNN